MSRKQSNKRRSSGRKDMNMIVIAVVVVLLIGAAVVFMNGNKTAAPANTISVEEAYQKREAGAYMLDVRTPEEWQEKHISDATLIPLDYLADNLDQLPTDQEIVIYCRSGNRSLQALQILQQAGFDNAVSMDGGINDWVANGYEVVTGP